MSEQNVKVAKTLYERFKAGDLAGALKVVASDVVWDEGDGHPYGPSVRGVNEVVERVFKRLKGDWDGLGTETLVFLDCGEYVVVLGQDNAVYKATGKRMKSRVVHVMTIRDGLIQSFTQYCDTHAWRTAMAP